MRTLIIALLLFPSTSFAACPGQTILSCPIGKKQLELCLNGPIATYSFGPKGRPELILSSPIATLDYTPWSGIGRSIWESVTFQNDGISYEVWAGVDRMAENAVYEGGVNVLKGDAVLAQLSCNAGSQVTDLDPVYQAKLAVGQCWNLETYQWDTSCPN